MATLVSELDPPQLEIDNMSRTERDAAIARLRAEGHWLARGLLGYMVMDYDDVVGILRDKRWQSAASLIAEMQVVDDPGFRRERRVSILSAEGDVHTRLRRLVAPAFNPRSADRLRPYMREVINGLVDDFAGSGRCEFVEAVCEPYPIPIICELLGAPKEDWRLFSRWATDLLRIFNFDLANDWKVIQQASDELDEYTTRMIARRRNEPAEDLLTDLIRAEEAGDKLSEEELCTMVNAVIVGGTDTTRNQLACSIAVFSDHPEQWDLLRRHPELAPKAVEETMRYLGAIRGTGRFASEDIEFRGVLFPKGTMISTSLASANRDPEAWPEPDRFDITREPTGQPQLTFGSGIHYCLGASLARAELQEALPILAERMPDLAVDGVIDWKPNGFGIWGPERLPLTFNG